MCPMNVNVLSALFLLLTGGCWLWILQDQQRFRQDIRQQVEEVEHRVRESDEINTDHVKSDFESSLNKRLSELEKKINYKFKDELVEWSKSLVEKGSKTFSQNDEDGVIEAVFDFIETTDKIYVEFGVESCTECNSKYLR